VRPDRDCSRMAAAFFAAPVQRIGF